ncbi:MAG: ABC transporter transmembrane domain-containing protein [Dysosmobacter sp.]
MAENNTKRGPGHGPGGPRGGFRKPKDLRGTLSKLMGYLGRYKALLVIVVILLFISAACSRGQDPISLKPLINRLDPPRRFCRSWPECCCVMAGVCMLWGSCAPTVMRGSWSMCPRKPWHKLRQDLFDKMQTLPLKFFDTHTHGELMSRYTNDIDTVSRGC